MTPDVGALRGPAPARITAGSPIPVLIQVPALSGTRTGRSIAGGRPRRRRLRREVRVAGTAFLLGFPVAWLVLTLVGGPHREALSASTARSEGDRVRAHPRETGSAPPVVSLWLEPVPSPRFPTGAADAPIVRPAGYIVPEDGTTAAEGWIHAGS